MAATNPRPRVWFADGAILVWDPALCEGAAEGPLLRFCDRMFALGEVSWVEIHLREATVSIQCGADRRQAATLLERMAASLKDVHAPRRPQVIQRIRREVEGGRETVRISRQLLGLPAAAGSSLQAAPDAVPARVHPARRSTVTGTAVATVTVTAAPTVTGARRIVYIGCAGLSFAGGIVGIWMPGLPTVPFMLLTSWLLSRSWPSLNRRLLKSRVVGPLLQTPRGLDPQVKIVLVAITVVTITMTAAFGGLPLPLLALVLLIGLMSLSTILNLPTVQHNPIRLEPMPGAA